MTLSDIVPSHEDGVYFGDVKVYLFGTGASNYKLTEGETTHFVGKSATFSYLSQQEIDENLEEEDHEAKWDTATPGWYQESDGDEEFIENMNDYKIPYGLGYAVKQFGTGFSIGYSGQVVKNEEMPSITLLNNRYVWTGNAAPKKNEIG